MAEDVKRKSQNYLDNTKLREAIISFQTQVREAKEKNLPIPRMSDELGSMIWMISENLAKKSNFANYTYRQDMVADGVENVLMYIQNYNPEISQNAFAYLTQIIYYAFLRRISKEKKQLFIKYKVMEQKHGVYLEHQFDAFEAKKKIAEDVGLSLNDVAIFEADIKKPDKASKTGRLDKFFTEEST